ncbi:MAG: T9SS type A sorting domain-containing protein [Saprospiraceae bacterium]
MKNFTTTLFILLFSTLNMTSYGQALSFDGTNDQFTVPSSGTDILGDFSVHHDFTVEVKVKFTNPAGSNGGQKVISKNHEHYGFAIETNGSEQIQVAVGFRDQGYGWFTDASTVAVVPNTWYNIAFVYDDAANVFYFYIDGVQIFNNNSGLYTYLTVWPHFFSDWASSSNVDMSMGYSATWGEHSNVAISYARFWNVAKTQAEIQSLQNHEVDCASANLLAQYKMNDGVAEGNNVGITTASDCTGNGHDASLTGFTMSGTTSNFVTEPAVLPVELTAFEGFAQKNSVFLNWSTATEENNEGFYVERSENGENWETIDFVAGNGTTFETQYYQYKDRNPYNGENYYRLKQIDFDGKFEYSNIITIENKHQSTNIKLFPNPVVDRLMINSESEIKAIMIFNAIGQPVLQQASIDNQQIEINVSDLPKGVYTLQIKSSNNETVIKQFIK